MLFTKSKKGANGYKGPVLKPPASKKDLKSDAHKKIIIIKPINTLKSFVFRLNSLLHSFF